MPKYVIERDVPGAGSLRGPDLRGMAQRSNKALVELGPDIQWVHSYITGDKIYCVYIAANEEIVRQHAVKGKFPANRISEIKTMIDPTTAES